ncbi:MAG: hypothetical protein FJY10_00410 [Bacteroidetes bacterium]|nr:hypothetical protein [Bacteroidota bacterium]
MKKRIILLTAILSLGFISLFAQPPHPNNGSGPGPGNTPVGGGAPIDGGLSILLALGLGYGAKRIYSLKKEQ